MAAVQCKWYGNQQQIRTNGVISFREFSFSVIALQGFWLADKFQLTIITEVLPYMENYRAMFVSFDYFCREKGKLNWKIIYNKKS